MKRSKKFIARVLSAYKLKAKYYTLTSCVGVVGVVIGAVPIGIYIDTAAPEPSYIWVPLLLLVGFPLSIYLSLVVVAALTGSLLAIIGKISWPEVARYAFLSEYPRSWFESDVGSSPKSRDTLTHYRIESPATKITGVGLFILGAGFSIGAFLAGAYLTSLGATLLVAMGAIYFLSSGVYELSDNDVIQRNLLGRFRMQWKDVRVVELGSENFFGGAPIVLHGRDQRFVMPPTTSWHGSQVGSAINLLNRKLVAMKIRSRSSFFAEFKVHKNVRVKRPGP